MAFASIIAHAQKWCGHPSCLEKLWNIWLLFCEFNLVIMVNTEAATRGVLIKKVFLEISQDSQENTCVRVSFLIKKRPAHLLKKRPWHRCFPVNFVKLLKTPFLPEHLRWLLLSIESELMHWSWKSPMVYWKNFIEFAAKKNKPDDNKNGGNFDSTKKRPCGYGKLWILMGN